MRHRNRSQNETRVPNLHIPGQSPCLLSAVPPVRMTIEGSRSTEGPQHCGFEAPHRPPCEVLSHGTSRDFT